MSFHCIPHKCSIYFLTFSVKSSQVLWPTLLWDGLLSHWATWLLGKVPCWGTIFSSNFHPLVLALSSRVAQLYSNPCNKPLAILKNNHDITPLGYLWSSYFWQELNPLFSKLNILKIFIIWSGSLTTLLSASWFVNVALEM